MSRYFAVQIDTVHLPSDGTADGTACKVQVRGIEAFRSDFTGSSQYAADGTPYLFLIEIADEGKAFEIVIAYCPKTLLDSLATLINEALNSSTTVRIIVSGDSGSFDVQALPHMPQWLNVGEFSGLIIKDVTLRFISAGAGE